MGYSSRQLTQQYYVIVIIQRTLYYELIETDIRNFREILGGSRTESQRLQLDTKVATIAFNYKYVLDENDL